MVLALRKISDCLKTTTQCTARFCVISVIHAFLLLLMELFIIQCSITKTTPTHHLGKKRKFIHLPAFHKSQ